MIMDIEIKYQTCNLCDALCRNINNNFESVSFDVIDDKDIQVKIVLSLLTEQEKDYIDDLIAEFSAQQVSDCVLKPIVVVGNHSPLKYIVYMKE